MDTLKHLSIDTTKGEWAQCKGYEFVPKFTAI